MYKTPPVFYTFLYKIQGVFYTKIQISQKPLSYSNRILSIPLYMIAELSRIVADQV